MQATQDGDERDWLRRRGGALGRVWRRCELDAGGVSWRQIDEALSDGGLERVRRGVYVDGRAHPALKAALAAGAKLACATAAAAAGVFVLDERRLHLQCRRSRAGAVAHWSALPFPDEAEGVTVGLRNALWQIAACLPFPEAVAAWDSAFAEGVLLPSALDELVEALPESRRGLADWLDPSAESGPESMVRVALRRSGLTWISQARVPAVGRVDGRLGMVLVEVDGREFHEDQERDYLRDLAAAEQGLATVRVDFRTATRRPEVAVAAVRGLLARAHPRWLVQNCSGFSPYPW